MGWRVANEPCKAPYGTPMLASICGGVGGLMAWPVAGSARISRWGVSTTLCCGVECAGLAGHQRGTHLVAGHRRKDFPYPARDQANLRSADSVPTTGR